MSYVPDSENSPAESTPTEFVRARFHGGRFAAHAIPFDVLSDLAAYRDLLVEVAKRIFLDRNAGRVRVPKGFVESFQLGLVDVVRGNSATAVAERIPVAPLVVPRQANLAVQHFTEFDEARDLIDQVIARAANDEAMPDGFPIDLAKKFNLFGKGLRKGEAIDLSHPGTVTPASFTREVRKRIILTVDATYEDIVDLRVQVTGGDTRTRKIFTFSEETNKSFELRDQSEARVLKALGHVKQHARLIGFGLFDRRDELQQIIEASEILYSEDEPSTPLSEQLETLRQTPAGWYRADTPAPDAMTISRIGNLLAQIVDEHHFQVPFLYPTTEGGVTGEWPNGDWEVSATLMPGTTVIALHALNIDSDEVLEDSFEIDSDHALARMADFWNLMSRDTGAENADSF